MMEAITFEKIMETRIVQSLWDRPCNWQNLLAISIIQVDYLNLSANYYLTWIEIYCFNPGSYTQLWNQRLQDCEDAQSFYSGIHMFCNVDESIGTPTAISEFLKHCWQFFQISCSGLALILLVLSRLSRPFSKTFVLHSKRWTISKTIVEFLFTCCNADETSFPSGTQSKNKDECTMHHSNISTSHINCSTFPCDHFLVFSRDCSTEGMRYNLWSCQQRTERRSSMRTCGVRCLEWLSVHKNQNFISIWVDPDSIFRHCWCLLYPSSAVGRLERTSGIARSSYYCLNPNRCQRRWSVITSLKKGPGCKARLPGWQQNGVLRSRCTEICHTGTKARIVMPFELNIFCNFTYLYKQSWVQMTRVSI